MSKKLLNWFLVISLFWAIAAGAVILEKPKGGLSGSVLVEDGRFGLSKKALAEKQVYATASGPYGQNGLEPGERGVWVDKDGQFTLRNLVTGEYTLTVKAKGYSSVNRYGLVVEEGKTTRIGAVDMQILEPSLYIASNNRVFTSREQPSFWVNLSGCEEIEALIYPVDLSKQLSRISSESEDLQFGFGLDLYKNYNRKSESPPLASQAPLIQISRKVTLDYNDSANVQFKLDKPLPAGEYYVIVKGKNWQGQKQWNIWWFSVSDLGLIVKQSPEKLLLRAIDLNTLKPLPGVSADLIRRNDRSGLFSLRTGSDGMAEYKFSQPLSIHQSYLVTAKLGKNRAYSHIPVVSSEGDHYQVYYYTERPIYRLGQTVYFKGIVRKLESGGLANAPRTSLKVTVEDPDGNTLKSENVITSPNGTFHGSFMLPEEGKTGGYQVVIVDPDQIFHYESIEVGQYRKPEFKVELKPSKERMVGGQSGKMRLEASYFSGAPVSNARIKYTVYYKPDWETHYRLTKRSEAEAFYDDWEEEGEEDHSSGYAGDFLAEGYAQTDSNGEATIDFQTRPISFSQDLPHDSGYRDQVYRVEAEVTDLTRMTVSGHGDISVTAGAYALLLDQPKSIYHTDQKAIVGVQAIDYEGRPVADRKLRLSLVRWRWQEKQQTYRYEKLEEAKPVSTDAQGKASLEIPIPGNAGSGDYSLLVESEDQAGHKIHDRQAIWIENRKAPLMLGDKEAEREPLSIKTDKKVYLPGEVAQILIKAPTTGQEAYQALVSVESTRIHEYHLVTLDASAKLLKIPMREAYAPNVYLTVTYVAPKHIFYNQTAVLRVSPKAKFLNLAVNTPKIKYRPGERIEYTIEAKYPDGKPAKDIELSLGVVDESIYAIRGEVAQDIRKFFYQKRPNWVSTLSSFPEEYSGGPDKIEPRLRKDFKDTAAWFPDLKTDQAGTARASFILPDNLTGWRATVRGIGPDHAVGQSTQNILAVQDLVVRLGLPRFFVQGDRGELKAVVSNYTDLEQEIQLDLEASSQFVLTGDRNPKRKIKPDGSESFTWDLRVEGPGEGSFKIKAYGEGGGDALLQKLRVLPLGVKDFLSQSGTMEQEIESRALNLKLPAGSLLKGANHELRLAGSVMGTVIGSLDTLLDYPHGCTEQTMSRLYPGLIVGLLEEKLGIRLTPALNQKLIRIQREALTVLKNNQNPDGGWGWWAEDQSVIWLTAYVMEGLKLLSEQGVSVPDGMIGQGQAWLKVNLTELSRQVSDPGTVFQTGQLQTSLTDLAHLRYVLSLYGEKVPDASLNKLFEAKWSALPPEALSYLILSGHPDSGKLWRRLLDLAKKTPQTLDWEHTAVMSRSLGLKDDYPDHDYRYSNTETTALATRAMLAYRPEEGELLSRIISWIGLQRDDSAWQNTKTTALVLRTLLDYELLPAQREQKTNFTVRAIGLDDVRGEYDQQNRYDPEKIWKKALSEDQSSQVVLEKNGSGKLAYQSLLTFFHALRPGEVFQEKGRPAGLSLKREFFRLEPSRQTASSGKIKLEPKPLSSPKAGEVVLMRITIDSPVQLPCVMLTAPLPSGGEVLDQDPRLSEIEDDPYEGDWGKWWWTHRDLLDDRMVYFVRDLPAGKSFLSALIRVERPGVFQLLPLELQGMYSPEIRAYSSLGILTVNP